MIQDFVDIFISKKDTLFVDEHPQSYGAIVQTVIETIAADGLESGYGAPDPTRIHEIDDGDYQGTLLYVIAANGYQPSTYWSVKVSYGSCGGCDTLQGIHDDGGWLDKPTPTQATDYQTLALHIVQSLREI